MDDLYTGTNSGSFVNPVVAEQRTAITNEAREKNAHLLPAVEIMAEFIDGKIADANSLTTLLVDRTTSDEELRVDLMARKKFVELCVSLKEELKSAARKVAR